MYGIVKITASTWIGLSTIAEIEQQPDGSLRIYHSNGQRPSVATGEAARRLLALLEEVAINLAE